MDNYKPNSHKFKEEQQNAVDEKKRVEKVVKGNTRTKKNNMRKFTNAFISEDVKDVKSYVVTDLLVPAIKKTVSDIVRDGIDIILYGKPGQSRKRSAGSKISYRDYYDRKDDDRRYDDRPRSRFDYEDIGFENRGDAEAVLDHMKEVLDVYNVVTVADMYDLADQTAPFTSNKYGWTSLQNARVVRSGNDFVLDLPRAAPIDR